MGNVTAEWHNIWAHSVCWADMRNHLSGLWLSLVYSWKTISKYFVFFHTLVFLFLRMSPLLPAQRPTPSQLRHIPGSTSPSQPPRARIGWWDQGSRGPHHTGRVWRTEIASPWAITSTTTACRYGSLRYFSDTVFLGVTTLYETQKD